MKLPFTIYDSRFTIWEKSSRVVVAGRRAGAGGNHQSERGVALIITLILLSVTLFMAIAFLAISRRERGSVTTATDTATARLAADSALANAQAQIIANIFATTNPFNSSLVVSTNYINQNGFISGVANATNVNYDFLSGGGALNPNQFEQNIANLFLNPRAPVFVTTNQQTGASEFRYYLDLNRNGKFEDSGNVPNVNNFGVTNFPPVPEVGDPQWIGVLERPDAPHGPNNKFLSRYAFVALPADSLDLNAIHNQALHGNISTAVNQPPAGDVFFRNQGVGSWEINLAAFLADLNTNEWGQDVGVTANFYQYNPPPAVGGNKGNAFDDARALLANRYDNNFGSLSFVSTLLPNYPLTGPIDIVPFGSAMANTGVPFYNYSLNIFWPGADNTNHFFDLTADLFDTTKTEENVIAPALGFTDHLLQAGTNVSTYNRYTFYRLLSQLGTDSEPESGKMNLNYDNLDLGLNGFLTVNGTASATNLVPWTPIGFFTNAADRMLRLYSTKWFQTDPANYLETYYGIIPTYFVDGSGFGVTNVSAFGMTNQIPSFGVTNIPVYINGRYVYSSAIQRVLQLAANIYDATTNRFYDPVFNANTVPLPTLFEPVFFKAVNANVYITNFVEYGTGVFSSSSGAALTNTFPLDLSDPTNFASLQPFSFVYGVPIIVGAKKGLPNFNAFSMESTFQITRKLQLTRTSTNFVTDPISTYKINQAFNCSLSNLFAVECWNSYITNYARPTTIWVADRILMGLTNDQTTAQLWPPLDTTLFASITTNNWTGTGLTTPMNVNSFLLTSPTNLTAIALPQATYLFNQTINLNGNTVHFQPTTNSQTTFQNPSGLFQPHWGLTATNNLQVVLIDNITGRAIDYVQLHGPIVGRDLTTEILNLSNVVAPSSMWLTNFVSSAPLQGQSLPSGVENQLIASEQNSTLWNQMPASKVEQQIDGFRVFIGLAPIFFPTNAYGTNLEQDVPYTPTATPVQIINWQANDPLVHYLASDLFDSDSAKGIVLKSGSSTNALILPTPNERYQPWGMSVQMAAAAKTSQDASAFNLALKDPLIWSSDHWDFPANKFPTVGWLGRVHRGTPWQTVYLKASNILKPSGTNTWMNWTGNFTTNDAVNAAPVQDRLLFDVFTTALNDNATRGRLSVNVAANPNDPIAGLAAWSALFSGVMMLSNSMTDAANDIQLRTFHVLNPLQTIPSLTAVPVSPAGANGASSPVWEVVTNINFARTNFVNLDGANDAFEHAGDILSAPKLTELSPFLNLSTAAQITNGISDEMYEWLPQQTMGLLTVSSTPRYVIYSYGQTLKPAPNGITTDSQFFGMVTNYQVVSEIATRAVVRVNTVLKPNSDGTVTTNYSTTVEQFNVLPPD